jgi:hypothetical protein
MKKICKIFLSILIVTATQYLQAQPVHEIKHSDTTKPILVRPVLHNSLKINLSSLAFQNYSISYERLIKNKVSILVGYRYMPFTTLPYSNTISQIANNNNVNFNETNLGNYAFTGELRLYANKNMHGFYLAPYGRYANFNLAIPVQYNTNQGGNTTVQNAVFKGNITSISGGLLLGLQQHISRHFVFDIWLIGANFGNGNGILNANFAAPLTMQEQSSLQDNLNNINGGPFTVKGTVTSSTTANLNLTGPWIGIRALGINIGFTF